MKKFLLFIFLSGSLFANAQSYNNEWIDHSKTYYKFKISVTGLYRINHAALTNLGIQSTAAEQFQLWRNGKEIPLFTTKQTGVFTNTDYIEFWGEMNDGKPDLPLYRVPEYQLNDKWSLETDTAAFFLTVNNGANKRLVPATNVLPSVIPAEPYFIHTAGKYYKDKYNPGYGAVVGDLIYSSSYDQGEGWTSTDISTFASRTSNTTYNVTYGVGPAVTFSNLFTSPGGPPAKIKIAVSGNSLNARRYKMTMNGDSVIGDVVDYFDHSLDSTEFPLAQLNSNNAEFRVTNLATVSCPDIVPGDIIQPCGVDRMVVHKIELKYARLFNFGGANNFLFELAPNPAGNYLEIAGFNHGGVAPVFYDFTNGRRYIGDISDPSLVKVVLEPSSVLRSLLLVTQSAAYPVAVTNFQQRNFVNYAQPAQQGDFLIISHPALMIGTGGSTPVDDYRAYRSSSTGGNYNAKIYQIDQLIDQFGYGIKMHPVSVRNFLRWARNTYTSPVKDVFLIGKGLHYVHNHFYQGNADFHKLSFIPTWGIPASDNLLAADPGTDERPKVPIGRLSVVNADEVAVYLTKVKQYEQQLATSSPLIADRAWMKNVIHATGAGDVQLQEILDAYMEKYKRIISDTFYGGNVHSFSKTSSDPVEQTSNQRLQTLFTEGVSMITYFGHSSASTLEYNLDDPMNYNNPQKYPLFLLLGCNAGNFYNFNLSRLSTKETISEKYILAPERGGIASFASTHLGIVHYLDIYNTRNYNALAKTKYGHTFGEIMNEAITQTFNFTSQNDFYARLQCEQTTLHGDPAIKMYHFAKPDYAIEEQLIKISPGFISIAEDSFKVNASVMNIGKAINDSTVIELKRTYPNLITEVIARRTIRGIRFLDSLIFSIPIVATRDKGLNKITVTIDPDNKTDELYETNNSITKDVFIFEDELRPVYPYNYSIVNNQSIKFRASTADVFSSMKQYKFEIDTTTLFNSSLRVERTVSSTGGVIEFTSGITYTNNTVYYWRVAAVPASGPVKWNVFSFVYLSNTSDGFNQSHYFQHTESSLNNMLLLPDRTWGFDSTFQNLFARNTIFPEGGVQQAEFTVSVNGSAYIGGGCNYHAVIFNVFNPKTFLPIPNNFSGPGGAGLYGSLPQTCGDRKEYNFEFSYLTPAARTTMMNFMENVVQNGYYVVARLNIPSSSPVPPQYPDIWRKDTLVHGSGKSLWHSFVNQGFDILDSFNRPRTWIFVYQKNNPGNFTPKYTIAQTIFDKLSLDANMRTSDTVGVITSPQFGRAKKWKTLELKGSILPDPSGASDSARISVIGVTPQGIESLLIDNLDVAIQNHDISTIDADEYPYLRLRLFSRDKVNYTPYNLEYWRILYDPSPEGAIAPNIFFQYKDTVDIGEPVDFKVAFKNVSHVPFDSLKVKLVITDRNNVQNIIPLSKRKPLTINGTPGDTVHLSAKILTTNLPGINTLFIEANPDDDQPEQFHFNNFAFRNFYVKPDSLNPLLDVTFDGVHILNRDIVSSKPDIIVKLKDEAKWMVLDDTSLLTLHVRYPNGTSRRFYFNSDTLNFTAAGQAPNPDNTATINFKPYFVEDGEYEMIISGKDRSGNDAGAIEYRVIFEVINKPMISNMLNYPNPFTSSTAFVFTITGSEVPQNIKIEIMTITGKIVREITKHELGPLHIGRNITEFKWDGTDQFGQKLANGIYLYRVVTNLNGKTLDKYKSENDNTDKYFNKGYGKMYLMR